MNAQNPELWKDWLERLYRSARALDESRLRTDLLSGEIEAFARVGREAIDRLEKMALEAHS